MGSCACRVSATTSAIARPAEATVQESSYGDLVGGVQPSRGASPRPSRLVGERQAGEGGKVRRLEIQAPEGGEVERTVGLAEPVRVTERVTDGETHVGEGELGNRRPVAELDHRVHRRLGVYDDLDVLVVDAEELAGFYDLETLVHKRRRVDGYLRSHVPGWMSQGIGKGHRGQLSCGAPPEGPPARCQHQFRVTASGRAAGKALVYGAVLGVDWEQLGPLQIPDTLHDGGACNKRLLVRQGKAAPP